MERTTKEMDLRQITVDGIKMKFDFQYFGKNRKAVEFDFSLHGGGQMSQLLMKSSVEVDQTIRSE
ncbi:MAG: hypothetical protein CM15mP87_10070 [Candidatus Neomarinimicrobiota bacterium]|nr:MAG: hypothetical protein CM15mP87_10070 [Candidatus Neomarinimicrobiota bacterium]